MELITTLLKSLMNNATRILAFKTTQVYLRNYLDCYPCRFFSISPTFRPLHLMAVFTVILKILIKHFIKMSHSFFNLLCHPFHSLLPRRARLKWISNLACDTEVCQACRCDLMSLHPGYSWGVLLLWKTICRLFLN